MLTIRERQTRSSPVIVGDHYELAETLDAAYGSEHFGGLLAKPDETTALLSMSGYEKSQNAGLNEFDAKRPSQSYASPAYYNASRPPQEPMYPTYALPGLSDPNLQPQSTAYDRHADQMSYAASSMYQPRASYEATSSSYGEYQPRKIPELSSYNPQRGNNGTRVYVYLDSSSDLLGSSPLIASLMFATRRIPAALNRLDHREHDVCDKYVVTATAPSFADTGSPNARIPLRLQLLERSGLDAGLIDVGPWLYEDRKQREFRSAPEITRKRKSSEELYSSAKRETSPQAQTGVSQDFNILPYGSNASLAYPQSLHSIDLTSMQRKLTPYGRAQNQQSLQDDSASLGYSQSLMRSARTQTPSWSPSYTAAYRPSRSPGMSSAPSYLSSIASSNPANPPLVRASAIETQPGSASTSGASSSDGSFNPYALYPNRATIRICGGKLNTMQDDWTVDERAVKRRLVLFKGDQSGSTINAYFRAVKPDERPSPHATRERRISCIYWEEKKEYFVTSVDTIALLETLVGARFTVEEKNRIRRNLETHHPYTISKAKPETENFFKVIMGFPNPKPRNIEKDVKVFTWPSLENALKKVISKYSASHSSTAGPLLGPQRHTYTHSSSSRTDDPHADFSSHSASSTSSIYAQTSLSATLSPPNVSQHLAYSQPSPMHPSLSHTYTVPTLASQYPTNDLAPIGGYSGQVSIPDLSHAYTTSAIGRRRSSEANTDHLNSNPYATSTGSRPRAQNSFAALYAPQDDPSDYGLQLPTAGQPVRGSWDFSAYLQPDTNATIPESPQAVQYRRMSMAQARAGANQRGYVEVVEEEGEESDE